MKRTIAILLVAIHLFNLAGYQAVFAFLQFCNAKKVETTIDKGLYSDAELITLKVHYPLPYAVDWKEYEKCDGSIEVDGLHYNYVKKKLANDTLYLMCIPNYEQTSLSIAKSDFNKTLSDCPNNSGKEKGKPVGKFLQKNLCVEYKQTQEFYSFLNLSTVVSIRYYNFSPKLIQCFKGKSYQPPKQFV